MGMLFTNSYIDPERSLPPDARDRYIALAPQIVREPISTHFVRVTRGGKACFLVIDRAVLPSEGGIAVVSTDGGLKVRQYSSATPLDKVWGTVVWYIQQG